MSKIAIIILGYNSQKHYPDCLTSLQNLDYPKDQYNVFIFDNCSENDSAEYLKVNFPEVTFVCNKENYGFALGNNKAVEYLADKGYDYYLFLNDDTISDNKMLTELVKVLETNQDGGSVQARLMLYPDKDKVNSIGNQIHYLGFGFSKGAYQPFNNNLETKEITYGSGAALLVKKEIINKLGLFEPDFFMYHEDLDFGWKLRLAGYKIFLAPQAIVYHKYKFAKSLKQYYWMERNRFICILKNYKWKTIALITPACLIMELGLFLFAIKSGFWKEKLKVYVYFLKPSSWYKILKRRKFIKKIRKIKDREVVTFFVGKIENQEIDNFILKKIANPVFNLYWRLIRILIIW